jgi:hypothetical protein
MNLRLEFRQGLPSILRRENKWAFPKQHGSELVSVPSQSYSEDMMRPFDD